MEKPKIKAVFSGHEGNVRTLCFTSDQSKLCSGGEDKRVIVWDLESELSNSESKPSKKSIVIDGHTDYIWSVDSSPRGRILVSGNGDRNVYIWDISKDRDEKNDFKLGTHMRSPYSVRFCHDGEKVVSGSEDKCIKVWDVEKKEEFLNINAGGCVFSIDVMQSIGQLIYSGDIKGTIKLWDMRDTKKCIHTFLSCHKKTVRSLRHHIDTNALISGSYDNSSKHFDLRTFKEIHCYNQNKDINGVSFHPSGKYMITGCDDCSVKLYDLEKKKLLFTLTEGISGWVFAVSFSIYHQQGGECFFASGSSGFDEVVLWKWKSPFYRGNTKLMKEDLMERISYLQEHLFVIHRRTETEDDDETGELFERKYLFSIKMSNDLIFSVTRIFL